jgi:hypothetical protein
MRYELDALLWVRWREHRFLICSRPPSGHGNDEPSRSSRQGKQQTIFERPADITFERQPEYSGQQPKNDAARQANARPACGPS